MKTFKTFLSDCGVEDTEELILFLQSLPDNPQDLAHMPGIERFMRQIDIIFNESDNNL